MNEEKNNLPKEEVEMKEENTEKHLQKETEQLGAANDTEKDDCSYNAEKEEPQEFVKKAKKISVMTFILIAVIFFALMTVIDLIEAFVGHTASLVVLVGVAFVLAYFLYGGKKK